MNLADFWNILNLRNKNAQKVINSHIKRNNGIYYTNTELTDLMIKDLFNNIQLKYGKRTKSYILQATFFEPCVGIGNFVFSYLKYLFLNFKFSNKEWIKIIDHIYVSDNDNNAIKIYSYLLTIFTHLILKIKIRKNYFQSNIGKGLIFDNTKKNINIIYPSKYFNINKFDIIITNPPYVNFRAQKQNFQNLKEFKEYKNYYKTLKKIIPYEFKYQGTGTYNIYKLFIESIINSYLKNDGITYLLVPQQILKDKSTTALRELLLSNDIKSIRNFNEDDSSVYAHQALSAILVSKSRATNVFKIYSNSLNKYNTVRLNDVKNNPKLEILNLSSYDKRILNKSRMSPKLCDLSFVTNMRGELDLSNNKSYLTLRKTPYKLLKGRNIDFYKIKDVSNTYYVKKNFIRISNKSKYIPKSRLACRQISNMRSKKRLKFSIVPSNFILGNSVNYIYVRKNKYGINLYYLLGLFNSATYEQLFRMFSSNNHVNNYNIDAFPVPLDDYEFIKHVSILAKAINNGNIKLLNTLNNFISLKFTGYNDDTNYKYIKNTINEVSTIYPNINNSYLYGVLNHSFTLKDLQNLYNLNKNDLLIIKSIIVKNEYINQNKVLNHTSFSLSKLDIEMISNVKQGGNWKQIPLRIAKKSKRLMGIRKTGGRTTLYGRLDYHKPSYTITTYFSRPGNGTNVHPIHNRVLSVREAARIQSFPDDYLFVGAKKDKLLQIGNAVPPFISYQIGYQIKKYLNVGRSLDLFSGAGGLTLGFMLSGYKSLLDNDINQRALDTMLVNTPSLNVLTGDINNHDVINYIIKNSIDNGVDIINGGPPCQGFSLAGFRKLNDPRSKLIFKYVEVLSRVQPKVFVFENVPGLLSINKHKIFNQLINLFYKVGYKIKAKKLDFSNYGIPQKRKRVIIIGIRKDIDVNISDMFPKPTTIHNKITVFDAISDLDEVPLDQNEYYNKRPTNKYCEMLRGLITPNEYLRYLLFKN